MGKGLDIDLKLINQYLTSKDQRISVDTQEDLEQNTFFIKCFTPNYFSKVTNIIALFSLMPSSTEKRGGFDEDWQFIPWVQPRLDVHVIAVSGMHL